MTEIKEGFLPYKGYKTYYKTVGVTAPGKFPLLVLHGGPGSCHNYMLPLAGLAETGRQIIFYDQLGCGKSDQPEDDSLWVVKTFLDELKAVREHLGLKEIHLLGQSWGGMLAIEYLLTKPKGIQSAVLASAMISMPLYQAEVEILKKDLPPEVYKTLRAHEAAGTTDSQAYAKAYEVYGKHHLFRGETFPKEFESPTNSKDSPAYHKMWGASEAYADGDLKAWDKIGRLHEITVPTLITSGQYDELTPRQALVTHAEIPGSEIEILTAGSHCAHIEHPDEYNARVAEFLDKVEKR
jgi:proline-specific peptidase